ncbi:hypothetical protein [Streptomyces rishiriensis]|uniref:Uncharacterized protein n=1 Tax=Streptomyces rishiriensis TaxID=68264 RepID=A0ABU0NWT1_STRRH|nr:hypothetical protein [Streptomyces rishiriensis]MDQ0583569.1 hypothetical protein [Streptomyces rishiriensis]
MLTRIANEDSRLSFWLRVREFAVPASMIETATVRRSAGDWAGACAAAGIDVDLDLRAVARAYGREFVSRLRADLRHLAPDLLRWHMPRVAPDGLLRPGLTVSLARYDVDVGVAGRDDTRWPVHLVVRTPPAWADAGQRFSLGLWDGSSGDRAHPHPHPRPSRRFRFDLHRHLWDARRADELRTRAGDGVGDTLLGDGLPVPDGRRCAADRWADEAAILLRADGATGSEGTVLVRLGGRHRLVLGLGLQPGVGGEPSASWITAVSTRAGGGTVLPVLPDAATWVAPDLELIRSGAIDVGLLHPLVASALLPDPAPPPGPSSAPSLSPAASSSGDVAGKRGGGQPHLVECRGEQHRIGLVDGVLAALDHGPDEVRREELLVALTGTPLPCLQAIDDAHRRPDCLTGVRDRLVHGDVTGALAVVEELLGPDAILREGALRDELQAAARRRITYGLFRAGLAGPGPGRVLPGPARTTAHRSHPRHTFAAR